MTFEYGKTYVYINNEKKLDYNNKYSLITFLLDRQDKQEYIFEHKSSLVRFFQAISYKDKNFIITIEEFIISLNNEIEILNNKLSKKLPPIEYVITFENLTNEINTMKNNLLKNKYSKQDISTIEKSIKQKEKGVRRLKKKLNKHFYENDIQIDNINILDYDKNYINKKINYYKSLLEKINNNDY